MPKKYVLALDAGTTSSRAILFDHNCNIVSLSQQEFPQIYPQPGWVEHDPMEIWNTQLTVAKQSLERANAKADEVAAIGIANQRETTIVWDKNTGKPIMNGIVWQDRRTAPICEELISMGLTDYVHENTGLVIDAYFSGTKIKWILDNIVGARAKAEKGELLFGTVDSWLIWNLTGGLVHVTDYSNASRTLLFNIKTVDWDPKLIEALTIPRAMLPVLRPSSEIYGMTSDGLLFDTPVPVASAIGDQQGALFGQACFESGMAKATYGTGGSLLMNTGTTPTPSKSGLLTTVAWGINGTVSYALEGLFYIMGASVQWLRDELKIIHSDEESAYYAAKVPDTNGVYMVPAFVGLSAPDWNQYARGAILGLTRGANRNHLIRATLESMAYQVRDVVSCMEKDSGISNNELKVDGGASLNDFVLQFQADILNVPVLRPKVVETTARGAAFLAGLAAGFWKNQQELVDTFELDHRFEGKMDKATRDKLHGGWRKAVERTKDWEEH